VVVEGERVSFVKKGGRPLAVFEREQMKGLKGGCLNRFSKVRKKGCSATAVGSERRKISWGACIPVVSKPFVHRTEVWMSTILLICKNYNICINKEKNW